MNLWILSISILLLTLLLAAGGFWKLLRSRNMHLWLGSYYFGSREAACTLEDNAPLHVFIALCDHYEPEWSRPAFDVSLAKVDRWVRDYPRLFGQFQDSRGQKPQHTFFYPQDEYRPEYLDRLADLCRQGYGDVDIHLHHDGDTADSLRAKLNDFKHELYHRHGLLRTDPVSGEIVYGFIHGNWALCNSRPDGRWCGVNEELTVLKETGCYADFTLPSAPSDTQTRTINSIYYAHDCPHQSKSHDHGSPAQVGREALNGICCSFKGRCCRTGVIANSDSFPAPRMAMSTRPTPRPGIVSRTGSRQGSTSRVGLTGCS
ncbi:MAG: hypothetical protein U0903_06210 [Planctomycetales bacterium]